MGTKRAKQWLAVAAVWLVISGGLAVLAKVYINPKDGTHRDPNGPTRNPGGNPNINKKSPPIATISIRFRPGTAEIMQYSQDDLETQIAELGLSNGTHSVRIVGHISPGSDQTAEKELAREQVEKVRSALLARGIRGDCISVVTSTDPDENGTYRNVATCEVVRKAR